MKVVSLNQAIEILNGKSLDTEADREYIFGLLSDAAFDVQDGTETVTSLISFYDQEEVYPDCTVQVLTNSHTGDISVGWWKNREEEL